MTNNKPKISIIIPTYNVEKYLGECLDTVINQTLQNIEIICINDGSTDNSGKILDEYSANDSRIKVIHKENEGVGITRNLGINMALGEFVCFMDPDDLYPTNDILEVLYNKATDNNVLIAGGEFSTFTNTSSTVFQKETEWENKKNSLDGYLFSESKIINYREYQFDYGYHRFIYNREFLVENNIYFPNYKRFQDPPFFVNAMIKADKFYALHKITYGYRCGHQTVRWDSKRANDMLKGILDNFNYADEFKLAKLKEYTTIRYNQHFQSVKNNLDRESLCLILKISKYHNDILSSIYKAILESIFSIKNTEDRKHKVIMILGLKFKVKRKAK